MARKRLNPRRRHKCGKPVLEPRDPVVTPELLDQRRRITPGLEDAKLMDQRAGVALDQLLTLKHITPAQRDAGEEYGSLVRKWRRLHGVPNDHRQRASAAGNGGDIDPAQVERANAQIDAASRRLGQVKAAALVRVVVDSVCVDEVLGRVLDRGELGDRLRAALTAGLDALALEFRLSQKRAA
jgi:hypothetical protein